MTCETWSEITAAKVAAIPLFKNTAISDIYTIDTGNGVPTTVYCDMTTDGGGDLDSVVFTDLRASYNPKVLDDALSITLGFNNVLDEDPPVCFPCGVIGLSTVSHDLPGRVGYIRVTYER